MMRMEGFALSHVGAIRKVNQDRAMFSNSLGAVADGMGGHKGGEQAASIVITELLAVSGPLSRERLLDVVRDANGKVVEAGLQPELQGMGTTLVAATLDVDEGRLTVVNVGDSRAYRLRGDLFEQITVDHSLVEELVQQGRISRLDAETHPKRNIVTRAIGLSDPVEIDAFDLEAQPGDRILLCSDGLINEVPVEIIAATLAEVDALAEVADRLVELAVEGGGRDNVSVVVIDLVDDEVEAPERPLDIMIAEPDFVDPNPTEPIAALWDLEPEAASNRKRTIRLVAALGAVALVALFGINWFAGNAYFASEQDGEVVIFQGRPGGVLWIDPELVQRTGIPTDELDDASIQRLDQMTQWSSRDDVDDFVQGLGRVEVGAG